MTNKTKGPDYSKATPDLVKRVKEVIADDAKRTYSVSKIYGAYNEAFGLNETPQSCSTCLVNRAKMLVKWLAGYEAYAAGDGQTAEQHAADFAAHKDAVKLVDVVTDEAVIFHAKDGAFIDVNGNPAPTGIYQNEADGKRYDVDAAGKFAEVVTGPEDDAPALGVTRIPMPEGAPIDLTRDEGVTPTDPVLKGTVRYVDGSTVKPGTYVTQSGAELTVQVGHRGTLKVKEDDLT